MKTGEYIGKDGRTYRWTKTARGNFTNQDEQGYGGVIVPEDWPAAKAALDALIAEQDAERWVYLSSPPEDAKGCGFRITPDGTKAQFQRWGDAEWQNAEDGYWSQPRVYRKGREVAKAENEALREQVRALVAAVEAFRWPLWRACDDCINWGAQERIHAAAKKVQL